MSNKPSKAQRRDQAKHVSSHGSQQSQVQHAAKQAGLNSSEQRTLHNLLNEARSSGEAVTSFPEILQLANEIKKK